MRFRVQPVAGHFGRIGLYLFEERDGRVHPVNPLSLAEQPLDALAIEPTTTISEDEAAQLMTDLWNAGVRPNIPAPGEKLVAAKDLHITQLFDIVKLALAK